MDILRELIKERQFIINIPPVEPELNETRHIVKIFNSILKTKVLKEQKLHWLDFFEGLLEENGSRLKKDYELDGTHLSPKYVEDLLQPALNKVEL